jgi:hypothetical protein
MSLLITLVNKPLGSDLYTYKCVGTEGMLTSVYKCLCYTYFDTLILLITESINLLKINCLDKVISVYVDKF